MAEAGECGSQTCQAKWDCVGAGQPGHSLCGHCPEHDDARHHCGCWYEKE